MNPIRQLLATALVTLISLTAASQADTEIGDDVEIDAETGFVITVAFDNDAKAVSNVASVLNDTTIGDDFEVKLTSDEIVTLAIGRDTRACTNIGSVGAEHACE